MYHHLFLPWEPFSSTFSAPLPALLHQGIELLVARVLFNLRSPLEGGDRLLPVAAAALVHAALADLHDLAPQVNLLEDSKASTSKKKVPEAAPELAEPAKGRKRTKK